MRVLPLLALLVLCACAGPRLIKPSTSADKVHRELQGILKDRGFDCTVDKEDGDLTCEADRTYKVVMEYRDRPPRLYLYAWFDTAGRACPQLDSLVSEYNKTYPTQVSCVTSDSGGASLRFFSSTIIPEAGLTATEVSEYLGFWSSFIHDSAYETGLFIKEQETEKAPVIPS